MHQPLTVGNRLCLRLPDGRVLGHVCIERLVDTWAEGDFQPGTAFEEYRPLFEREAQLRHDQIIPLWEDAAQAIDALGIQVIEETQHGMHPGLRVFVEGTEAIIGTATSN